MKVEKAREKDGKLELLVELSVAETEEELQNAAMAVVARNGYGADRADYETPLERVRARMGLVEASFVLDEEIMRRRAPFALSAVRVDTVGAPCIGAPSMQPKASLSATSLYVSRFPGSSWKATIR